MCYMNTLLRRGTRLLICDMAGTIIQENGAVYKAIANSLNRVGCNVANDEIREWHGRSKDEVISEVLNRRFVSTQASEKYEEAMKIFNEDIHFQYFQNNPISLIADNIPEFFNILRMNGIKIGLNTGYSKPMQEDILKFLKLDNCIDHYISTDDVTRGRPYPYMIYHVMEEAGIQDIKTVAKAGDTIIDMQEGKNAGCGLTIGVLSGAVTRKDLENSKEADIILKKITDLN